MSTEWVFLNGTFVPYEQAMLPIEDRGLIFGDGIYEVVQFYRGKAFRMEDHLARLKASAGALRIPLPLRDEELVQAAAELARRNGLESSDSILYLQVTRGVARRSHAFPPDPKPSVFMTMRPSRPVSAEQRQAGVAAITLEDRRWTRCNIKSIALLGSVLAKQEAQDAGCYEAILYRDGYITEGSSTNVFLVMDGVLYTHPEGPYILSGITRQVTLELAEELNIPVRLQGVAREQLEEVSEVFITGTTTEILPVTRIDGRPVGSGRPGPLTRQLWQAFEGLLQRHARDGA